VVSGRDWLQAAVYLPNASRIGVSAAVGIANKKSLTLLSQLLYDYFDYYFRLRAAHSLRKRNCGLD